jgi:transposase InsO family protein
MPPALKYFGNFSVLKTGNISPGTPAHFTGIRSVLKENNMLHHRYETKPKTARKAPRELEATGPIQVWSWDITYISSHIKGKYFYLYMIEDVWSRKIVGWKIHEEECSEHAARMMAEIGETIDLKGLYLHSDNGSPMKGATMLSTLQRLQVMPSFSRPSVSNDNPYSESLFKTLKYNVKYPGCPGPPRFPIKKAK